MAGLEDIEPSHLLIPERNLMTSPMLSLRGIKKSFGPVQVLNGVDFDAHAGQVTALVGDNGAGKSTLIKCMSGIYGIARLCCWNKIYCDWFGFANFIKCRCTYP